MNVRRAGLACLALLLAVGTVAAQEVTRGSMIVRVEDPTGAVIPGANVTIVANVQPELTKETRPDGEILFANLIPGTYTVTVAVSGFKTARVENVDLRLGERRLVSVTLEPGQLVQTVEVIGAAGGVDLSTTTTGGHIQDT
ncbi:MAG: carboxypeptidase-like regulatory domain-containing protein, partial [Terriglobia bacterium]